jgi:predicted phosphodiesterase
MKSKTGATSAIAVVGDTHGHLQLALCVLARWRRELKVDLEAVFLCGDVGTFTDPSQIDNATRRHGKENPCELEFLQQWSRDPQPPWLDAIFDPEERGGLGLRCPVVMVHGNHEGFDHLEKIVPAGFPRDVVALSDLPAVDARGRIRILPSGWRAAAPSGRVIAGIGGIEEGQRRSDYHRMAYTDPEAVLELRGKGPVDILITHQGPAGVQGEHGSESLQILLDAGIGRIWFHGHSCPREDIVRTPRTVVVPLRKVAFDRKSQAGEPGIGGWAVARSGPGGIEVIREDPPFLREFRRHHWVRSPDGRLVAPPLARFAWPAG